MLKKIRHNIVPALFIASLIAGIVTGGFLGHRDHVEERAEMRQVQATVESMPRLESGKYSSKRVAVVKIVDREESAEIFVGERVRKGDVVTIWTENGVITSKQYLTASGLWMGMFTGVFMVLFIWVIGCIFAFFVAIA